MDAVGELRFTAAEAAPLLGLASADSVYKYVHLGKLNPSGKRGRQNTYRWADLWAARDTPRMGLTKPWPAEDYPL